MDDALSCAAARPSAICRDGERLVEASGPRARRCARSSPSTSSMTRKRRRLSASKPGWCDVGVVERGERAPRGRSGRGAPAARPALSGSTLSATRARAGCRARQPRPYRPRRGERGSRIAPGGCLVLLTRWQCSRWVDRQVVAALARPRAWNVVHRLSATTDPIARFPRPASESADRSSPSASPPE